METTLNDTRREEIWYALSGAFVDNEVDYSLIARQVNDANHVQVKEIFFTEVAPYCYPNLMTAIPPIWSCFPRDDLISGIREKLANAQNHLIARLRYKGFVVFCRWYFRKEWQSIAAELLKLNLA
ncbi:hypothetical protein FACS1894185_6010 [Betaproteobacteria bacterium]|nr:hypothetical protein FACS1894185_6010 [Betaproteobacteria bacterium]GHU16400.1 hypothetical protein FACS189441_8410 [Betaproteobacteria bacterium]